MTNKNSTYVQSLVDFILDTKPYHSKLTEIVEEYQFFDTMDVVISEQNSIKTKVNPAWLFEMFSSGDPAFRNFKIKNLESPSRTVFSSNASTVYPGSLKAFRDENTDMASVPFVFSKKTFDGDIVPSVQIERNGIRTQVEPLIEGVHFFQSHGSFQFQVKQTLDANLNFVSLWSETRNDNVISTVSAYTRTVANDLSNPNSACSKVLAVLLQIQAIPGLSPAVTSALNALLVIVNTPQLPQDYEPLLRQLKVDGTPVLSGFSGWIHDDGELPNTPTYVADHLSSLSPSMYFNMFSDSNLRESGQARYEDISTPHLIIQNVNTSALSTAAGDTWTLIANPLDTSLYSVFSSVSGFIGTFDASIGTVGTPGVFGSFTVSFEYVFVSTAPANFEVKIQNVNRIVFGTDALLETWNIIKVNPIAYTNPSFVSTRYGFIQSLTNVVGSVSLLDIGIPSGTITLTAIASGQSFNITSDVEPLYTGQAQVGFPFNDGRLGFTIVQGSASPFKAGDKFYISILNESPVVLELDLGFGYDLDSYDDQETLDSSVLTVLNFAFGTRFSDYNLSNFNLVVGPSAVPGRRWKVEAIPDLSLPVLITEVLGVGIPDIEAFYATNFEVSYSDDDWASTTSLGTIPVGGSFSSTVQDVSFTVAPGSKAFIGVRADDGAGGFVLGGDAFSFLVQNVPPVLTETPVQLISSSTAYLQMYADSFFDAPAAFWSIQFSSSTEYTVSGVLTAGGIVPGSPAAGSLSLSGSIAREGNTWNALGVHFTFVPGDVGFGAGDTFTFQTYERKPSFLVHGSVSGWQEDAVIGEAYWNGHIGFTIQKPTVQLFNQALPETLVPEVSANTWNIGAGRISMTRLRDDVPNIIYTLEPTPISGLPTGWKVVRSDAGIVGFLNATVGSVFKEKYISLEVQVAVPTANIVEFQLEVTADDFVFWNAQDTIVLRTSSHRLPRNTDFVLIDKKTIDTLELSLDYSVVGTPPNISSFSPQFIDQRFIDLNEGNGDIPVSITSPETAILTNWIPLTITPNDSSSSVAEFPDSGRTFTVKSTVTGETIGELSSSTGVPEFTFSSSFFGTYLPLNASARIVTYGSGSNENLNVRISETLNILTSGGALSTDFLFRDSVSVGIQEQHSWNIIQSLNETIDAAISDGPFGGFLAGYDNLAYDEESQGYDTGVPLTGHFHEARELSGLDPMTAKQLSMSPAERVTRLSDLLDFLHPFLNGTLAGTTLGQFLANVDASLTDVITSGFGVPAVGMGMDITIGSSGANTNNPSTEGIGTGIAETVVLVFSDPSFNFDTFGFDIGGLDSSSERTAVFSLNSIPTSSVHPTGTTFEDFETGVGTAEVLSVLGVSSRVFEFDFASAGVLSTTMPTPNVFIWLPSESAAIQMPVVQKIGVGRYRVSVPSSTEAKLYLIPGL